MSATQSRTQPHLELFPTSPIPFTAINSSRWTIDVYGGDFSWLRTFAWLDRAQEFAAGIQVRYDDIGNVGLYRTIARERFATIREDSVQQTSFSV